MLAIRFGLIIAVLVLASSELGAQDRWPGQLRQRLIQRTNRGCIDCTPSCPCQDCLNGQPTYWQPAPGTTAPIVQPSQPPTSTDPQGNVVPTTPTQPDLPDNANLTSASNFDLSNQFAGRGDVSGIRDMTIGDYFSNSGNISIGGTDLNIPTAGGDRRYKMSDHFSPIPMNRTFFSYHGFGDAAVDVNENEVDVKRFTFGFERMFMQNNASLEVRIPFVHGLDSSQIQSGDIGGVTANEFGDVTVTTKLLLRRNQRSTLSIGSATTLPTASDAVIDANGQTLVFRNESIEAIPFIAYQRRPTANSWITLTSSLDLNVEGNEVISNPGSPGEERAIFNDQNLLSFDASVGRWFWQNPNSNRIVQAAAGIFEMHYTSTVNDPDEIFLGSALITNSSFRTDTLNSTIGLRLQLGDRTIATVAGVFPFRRDDDRPFENEFNLSISRLY